MNLWGFDVEHVRINFVVFFSAFQKTLSVYISGGDANYTKMKSCKIHLIQLD